MTILVHEAIGKHINPTRYRQIIETESSERLNLEEQHYITEDQKHSSTVAKIHYKKTQSRIVAVEGKKCMEKMTRDARSNGNNNLVEMFNNISCSFDRSVLEHSQRIIEGGESSRNSEENDPYQPAFEPSNYSTDLTISNTLTLPNDERSTILMSSDAPPNDNIIIKSEAIQRNTTKKNVKFTAEEDRFLKQGIEKYGKGAWALIIKDQNFTFHPSRTRDSLRVRSDSACFRKLFGDKQY